MRIDTLVDELVAILEDFCCVECPEDFHGMYEWVEDGDAAGACEGEFVTVHDIMVKRVDGLELVSVGCDEDGEPQETCFEITICELMDEVKAGWGTEEETVSFDDTEGAFCVTGLEDTNPTGKSVTSAVINSVFTCPAGTV